MNRRLELGSLHLLLFLSGFAGLGYEVVWARMLAVGLGHEIVALLAVVAAFFSGLALGAWALDGRISRSRYPGRWYAALEALIGLWSLALIVLIPAANELAAHLIGVEPTALRHWGVAFLLPFLLFLPATAAMGATLPAMERLVSRLRGGKVVGGLYAANTFGAVAGTMISTFWIAPALGFTATLLVLAANNALCALGVLAGAGRRAWPGPAAAACSGPSTPGGPAVGVGARRLLLTLFVTGLLGIGYEVLIIRMLSQILENTIYTFASVLSVYLLGTAVGGWLYQAVLARRVFEATLAWLLIALALACLGGVGLLWVAEPTYQGFRDLTDRAPLGGVLAELAVALLVFLLPTIIMGATFAHLAQGLRDLRDRLGHAVAVNTLGGSLAPLVVGLGLLPAVGAKLALLLPSVGYLALIPFGRRSRWAAAGVPTAIAVAVVLAPVSFRFVTVPAGGAIVAHEDGVMAAVTVVSDGRDHRHLKVNDEFRMGSTASTYSDRRQAQVPLLLHPDPRQALFLGLGTGATFAGVLDHPDLVADGVELVPEVVEVMPYFDSALGGLLESDRVRITVADARRFVRASERRYDVIVADVFHPSRDGAGSLYTVEHFRAVRERLAPGGLFCQWLPLFQLDLDTLRMIIRTFLEVFPDATAHLAHYSLITPMLCLVGSAEARRYPEDWFSERKIAPRLSAALAGLDLDDEFAIFGTFLGGAEDLARFGGDGPLNTDDRPLVTFQAPRAVYGHLAPTWGRLKSVIEETSPVPEDVLALSRAGARAAGRGKPDPFARRLAAYWRARDGFLATGTGVTPTRDTRALARQISGPLLAIVRQSPDFTPAYRPLLKLARDLSRIDPDAAGQLLRALQQANPRRDDARRLYAELFPRAPHEVEDKQGPAEPLDRQQETKP